MIYRPDSKYLKQAELDYSISLEKYHIACNSMNNLKTIISILVSLAGIGFSLFLPILFDKNQFISFFSINPEMYPPLLVSLSIIIILIVAGGIGIFATLFLDNSSSLFDTKISKLKLSHLPLITRYKHLTQKIEEITHIVSYKHDIYSKTLLVLIITSLLVAVITILFLNGLGSGDGVSNILLTTIIPSVTLINPVPMFIWVIVTLSLILHLVGFASLVFPFANSRNFDKKQHDISLVACILSYILCITLILFTILTNISSGWVVLLIINAMILMILPYGVSTVLSIYLLKVVSNLKKKEKESINN